jgi:small subunit ribosomal protein S3
MASNPKLKSIPPKSWASRWYATNRDFAGMLAEDIKVREYLKGKLKNAAVSRVVIERPAKNAGITIYSARPGVVIGKKGEDIEKLKKDLAAKLGGPVDVNIEEVRKPEIDAKLIAESITQQLENGIMFRRAMKRAMQNAMRLGALGIKIMSSGRLKGAEIARSEWYREGHVPLHTLRADIDYGTSEAKTTYGVIGVKVWVYKAEALGRNDLPAVETLRPEEERRPRGPRRERTAGSAAYAAVLRGGNAAPASSADKAAVELGTKLNAKSRPISTTTKSSHTDIGKPNWNIKMLSFSDSLKVAENLPTWAISRLVSRVLQLRWNVSFTSEEALLNWLEDEQPRPIEFKQLVKEEIDGEHIVLAEYPSGSLRSIGYIENHSKTLSINLKNYIPLIDPDEKEPPKFQPHTGIAPINLFCVRLNHQ